MRQVAIPTIVKGDSSTRIKKCFVVALVPQKRLHQKNGTSIDVIAPHALERGRTKSCPKKEDKRSLMFFAHPSEGPGSDR